MTFIITAKFVIPSIWSAQKPVDRIVSLIFPCHSSGKHTFCEFVRLPQQGDSNNYTKPMIHKKMFNGIRYSCFRQVHVKFFFYNSKFDVTAKSMVTNSVVITRVHCLSI